MCIMKYHTIRFRGFAFGTNEVEMVVGISDEVCNESRYLVRQRVEMGGPPESVWDAVVMYCIKDPTTTIRVLRNKANVDEHTAIRLLAGAAMAHSRQVARLIVRGGSYKPNNEQGSCSSIW